MKTKEIVRYNKPDIPPLAEWVEFMRNAFKDSKLPESRMWDYEDVKKVVAILSGTASCNNIGRRKRGKK